MLERAHGGAMAPGLRSKTRWSVVRLPLPQRGKSGGREAFGAHPSAEREELKAAEGVFLAAESACGLLLAWPGRGLELLRGFQWPEALESHQCWAKVG